MEMMEVVVATVVVGVHCSAFGVWFHFSAGIAVGSKINLLLVCYLLNTLNNIFARTILCRRALVSVHASAVLQWGGWWSCY